MILCRSYSMLRRQLQGQVQKQFQVRGQANANVNANAPPSPKALTQKRIAVALSGGIDSSVSAHLLSQIPNTSLIALHMSNWDASEEGQSGAGNTGTGTYCEQSEKDATDAQSVADQLGIKMHRVKFQSEYWHGVFEPFLEGMEDCRMINPDVGCNSIVKFGAMREYAMSQLGVDYIATGHYARLWHRSTYNVNDNIDDIERKVLNISTSKSPPACLAKRLEDNPDDAWITDWGMNVKGGRGRGGDDDDDDDDQNNNGGVSTLLLAGADGSKDQSYFLCGVNGRNFQNVIFPLGDIIKNDKGKGNDRNNPSMQQMKMEMEMKESPPESLKTVRGIAKDVFDAQIANKKESMGICFIGKRNFTDFIAEYLPKEAIPGDFIDVETGQVVGAHRGSAFYTIGQGAKISGATCKWFTVKKDPVLGTIYVCNDTHHPSLYSNELYMKQEECNWIVGEEPTPLRETNELVALCRTRHLQPLIPCVISKQQRAGQDYIVIKFDRPVRGMTPGQTAGVYAAGGLVCLGGGQIDSVGPNYYELEIDLPSQLHPSGSNDLSVLK